MKKSQVIFKAVDIFMKEPQNSVSFENIFCEKDIPYSDNGGEYTMGDMYYPPRILRNGKKYPVVINMHGGAFIMGDKKYRISISECFANQNFFVYNINYRMPPEVDLIKLISDTVDAFNYLDVLSETYNIDLDRIIVTGDSSGAYNASYLQLLSAHPEITDKIGVNRLNHPVTAAALFCGPYDLPKFMDVPMPFGIVPEMANLILDYPVKQDLSNISEYPLFDYISPINFVDEKWCPTFIAWAKSDLIVPEQGQPMADKLIESVEKVKTFEAQGLQNNHCFHLLQKTTPAKKCLAQCFEFLNEILAEEKEEQPAL